ncbi:MAG TPA: cation:proton antiporter, partial [Candidatus Thermoplasmatota archaeon]
MVGAFGAGLVGDLAVIMIASAVSILLFRRLRQPVVLGYLLAGMAVGPGSGLLNIGIEEADIAAFADLGVIFVLLFIGMEFDLRQLRAIGAPAIVIGTLEVTVMLGVGYALGLGMGLDPLSAVYLGALISISSTAVTIKILTDLDMLQDRATRLVFGVLVVEDFAAVILLSALSGTSNLASQGPEGVLTVILSVVIFFFATIFIGVQIIPRAFHRLERLGSEEVLTIAALGLSFGVALVATVLGYSPAMGAFLAGVLIGESGVLDAVRPRFEPIRDLFAAIFFVSVGMLIVPSEFLGLIVPILLICGVFLLGKIAAAGGATYLLGFGGRDGLAVGARLARTGEFSFIIGKTGLSTGAMAPQLYPMIAGVTLITTFLSPALIRRTPGIYRAAAGSLPPGIDRAGSAYTAWISRARNSTRRDPVVRQIYRQTGIRLFLTTVFMLIVSSATLALYPYAGGIATLVGTTPEAVVTALIGVAIGIVVYPVWVMGRMGKDLIDLTLQAAAGEAPPGRTLARTAVRTALRLVIVAGVLGLLFVGLSPLVVVAAEGANLPVLLVGLLVVFGLAGWRVLHSAKRLHARFETVFTAPPEPEATLPDGQRAPQQFSNLPRYLWAVADSETLAEYVLPDPCPLAGSSLGALKIRGRTGARVVAVQHGHDMQTAPPPTTRLHVGDMLLI